MLLNCMALQKDVWDGFEPAHRSVPTPALPVQPGGHLRIHLHDGRHRMGEVHRCSLSARLQPGNTYTK